jgi:hypothetical protein
MEREEGEWDLSQEKDKERGRRERDRERESDKERDREIEGQHLLGDVKSNVQKLLQINVGRDGEREKGEWERESGGGGQHLVGSIEDLADVRRKNGHGCAN